jgi:hypothetical protein
MQRLLENPCRVPANGSSHHWILWLRSPPICSASVVDQPNAPKASRFHHCPASRSGPVRANALAPAAASENIRSDSLGSPVSGSLAQDRTTGTTNPSAIRPRGKPWQGSALDAERSATPVRSDPPGDSRLAFPSCCRKQMSVPIDRDPCRHRPPFFRQMAPRTYGWATALRTNREVIDDPPD